MLIWVILPMFRRYMLPPSLGHFSSSSPFLRKLHSTHSDLHNARVTAYKMSSIMPGEHVGGWPLRTDSCPCDRAITTSVCKTSRSIVPTGSENARIPTLSRPSPYPRAFETEGCIYTETQHHTHFDHEDGGGIWNVGKIVHTHTHTRYNNTRTELGSAMNHRERDFSILHSLQTTSRSYPIGTETHVKVYSEPG
jgi:hypothetical protein